MDAASFQSAVAHELFSDSSPSLSPQWWPSGFKALSRMSSSPTILYSGQVEAWAEKFQSAVAHELFSDRADGQMSMSQVFEFQSAVAHELFSDYYYGAVLR